VIYWTINKHHTSLRVIPQFCWNRSDLSLTDINYAQIACDYFYIVSDIISWCVVARQAMYTSLSGHLAIITCCQMPSTPVSWTFQHSSDSEPQSIVTEGSVASDYSDRCRIEGASLIILKVQPSDSGVYNCSDAVGDTFQHNVTVLGN